MDHSGNKGRNVKEAKMPIRFIETPRYIVDKDNVVIGHLLRAPSGDWYACHELTAQHEELKNLKGPLDEVKARVAEIAG